MNNPLVHNPISNAIRNVSGVLDPDQKKRSVYMVILMVINAFFDFAGLATVALLITSSLENNIFDGDTYIRAEGTKDATHEFYQFLRNLYDWSGAGDQITFLFYLSVVILLAFIIKNAISLLIGYIQTRFAFNISLRLNRKMFKHFYEKGYLYVTNSTSGKKVYSIVDIPMKFAANYMNNLMILMTELIVMVTIGIALMLINPGAMLMLALTIIPAFYLIYSVTKDTSKAIGTNRNQLAPQNYARVFQGMNGYPDIKLANIENEILEQYIGLQKQVNKLDVKYYGIFMKLNQRTNDIVFGLGILVIFGYAMISKTGTTEILNLLGLFAIAAYKFLPAVNRTLTSMLTLKNHSYVFNEIAKIKDAPLDQFPVVEPMSFLEKVEANNISYQYPNSDEEVVSDVSFSFQKGETIGFIGTSGSGKSTLLKILLQFLPATKGKIEIDGQAITEDNAASFQKIIGYVQQEIFILNDTVRNNITMFADCDEQKIWESLREAQLEEYIKSHLDGLDMMLGENGVNLSGGQKQRIGIARALYKNSEILMFDEATSALDGETEKAVVESINHLSEIGKTILIVAHRISTLEKCNRIYELKEGKIIGIRTFAEVNAEAQRRLLEENA